MESLCVGVQNHTPVKCNDASRYSFILASCDNSFRVLSICVEEGKEIPSILAPLVVILPSKSSCSSLPHISNTPNMLSRERPYVEKEQVVPVRHKLESMKEKVSVINLPHELSFQKQGGKFEEALADYLVKKAARGTNMETATNVVIDTKNFFSAAKEMLRSWFNMVYDWVSDTLGKAKSKIAKILASICAIARSIGKHFCKSMKSLWAFVKSLFTATRTEIPDEIKDKAVDASLDEIVSDIMSTSASSQSNTSRSRSVSTSTSSTSHESVGSDADYVSITYPRPSFHFNSMNVEEEHSSNYNGSRVFEKQGHKNASSEISRGEDKSAEEDDWFDRCLLAISLPFLKIAGLFDSAWDSVVSGRIHKTFQTWALFERLNIVNKGKRLINWLHYIVTGENLFVDLEISCAFETLIIEFKQKQMKLLHNQEPTQKQVDKYMERYNEYRKVYAEAVAIGRASDATSRDVNAMFQRNHDEILRTRNVAVTQYNKLAKVMSEHFNNMKALTNPPMQMQLELLEMSVKLNQLYVPAISTAGQQSSTINSMHSKLMKDVDPWISGTKGTYRIKPVTLCMKGASGTGKTNTQEALIKAIPQIIAKSISVSHPGPDHIIYKMHAANPTSWHVRACVPKNEYDEGYADQMFYCFEEYLTSTSNEVNAEWSAHLMSVMDSQPLSLNMAFGDKGKRFFNSPFIIATGNYNDHFTVVKDPTAYFRRIELDLEVTKDAKGMPVFTCSRNMLEIIDKGLGPSNVVTAFIRRRKQMGLPYQMTFDTLAHLMAAVYLERIAVSRTKPSYMPSLDEIKGMPIGNHDFRKIETVFYEWKDVVINASNGPDLLAKITDKYPMMELSVQNRMFTAFLDAYCKAIGPTSSIDAADDKGKDPETVLIEPQGWRDNQDWAALDEKMMMIEIKRLSYGSDELPNVVFEFGDLISYTKTISARLDVPSIQASEGQINPFNEYATMVGRIKAYYRYHVSHIRDMDTFVPSRKQNKFLDRLIDVQVAVHCANIRKFLAEHDTREETLAHTFQHYIAPIWNSFSEYTKKGINYELKRRNGGITYNGERFVQPSAEEKERYRKRQRANRRRIARNNAAKAKPPAPKLPTMRDEKKKRVGRTQGRNRARLNKLEQQGGGELILKWNEVTQVSKMVQKKQLQEDPFIPSVAQRLWYQSHPYPEETCVQYYERIMRSMYGRSPTTTDLVVTKYLDEKGISPTPWFKQAITLGADLCLAERVLLFSFTDDDNETHRFGRFVFGGVDCSESDDRMQLHVLSGYAANTFGIIFEPTEFGQLYSKRVMDKASANKSKVSDYNTMFDELCLSVGLALSCVSGMALTAGLVYALIKVVSYVNPNQQDIDADTITKLRDAGYVITKQSVEGKTITKVPKSKDVRAKVLARPQLGTTSALMKNVALNTYAVLTPGGSLMGSCVFVSGTVALFNIHVFDSVSRVLHLIPYVPSAERREYNISKARCRIIAQDVDNDYCLVDVPSMRQHHNITQIFCPCDKRPERLNSGLVQYFDVDPDSPTINYADIGPIDFLNNDIALDDEDGVPATYNDYCMYVWKGARRGACGSLIWSHIPGGTQGIVGFHCAGDPKKNIGIASFVTREWLRASLSNDNSPSSIGLSYDDPSHTPQYMYVEQQGFRSYKKTSPMGQTILMPTPLALFEKDMCGVAPARLTKEAYEKAIAKEQKYAKAHNVHEDAQRIMSAYKEHIYEKFISGSKHMISGCEKLSLHDAVFGKDYLPRADPNTSAGAYLPAWGVDKRKLISDKCPDEWEKFSHHAKLYLDVCESENRPYFICFDMLKDELRPIEKVRNSETRIFKIVDFMNNIVIRVFMGDLLSKMKPMCYTTPSTCGVDPTSHPWAMIYRRLNMKPVIALDVRGMESVVTKIVDDFLYLLIKDAYQDTQDQRNAMYCVYALLQCLRFSNGVGVLLERTNPSGNQITTLLNTICNHIFFCVVVISLAEKNGAAPIKALHDLDLFLYSDDNLSAHPQPWYTPENIAKEFQRLFSVDLTATDKTEVTNDKCIGSIATVDFLSRRFVKHRGLVFAPLKLSSLIGQLYYVRIAPKDRSDTALFDKQLQQNIDNFVLECNEQDDLDKEAIVGIYVALQRLCKNRCLRFPPLVFLNVEAKLLRL